MSMEIKRMGLDNFLPIAGKNLVTTIPPISGNKSMKTMLIMSDKKSISKVFTSSDKEGRSEDQKRKLSGVMRKAESDDQAVNVTERATLPRAICE